LIFAYFCSLSWSAFSTLPAFILFFLFWFFYFGKKSEFWGITQNWVMTINVNSTRKISDHKIYALKIERVPNTFKNFNSFEMTLKMLKKMQIYQKCIFWGFHCFFALFWFFL